MAEERERKSRARNPMPDIREHDRVYVPQFDEGRVNGWTYGHVIGTRKTDARFRFIVELTDHTQRAYVAEEIECGVCHGDNGECSVCRPREAQAVLLSGMAPG